MDDQKIVDSLDSLWFFTNVLSLPITQPSSTSNTETQPILPVTPISQTRVPVNDISEENCPICHDFVAKVWDERDEEAEEEKLAEEKKVPIKSRFEGLDQERKIVGWLEDVNEFYAFWVMGQETRIGSQNVGKMPALSDDIAMKEHLKSWAYAVACAAN